MKKYNIKYTRSDLSESEIDRFKDFEGVVGRHEEYMHRKRFRRTVLVTIAMIALPLLVTASYFDVGGKIIQLIKGDQKIESPDVEIITEPEKGEVESVPEALPLESRPEIINPVESGLETGEGEAAHIIKPKEIYFNAAPAGGIAALYDYFQESIRYPARSLADSISGIVVVAFIVEDDGQINSIEVLKGINNELDLEARRLVREMPPWNSASLNGRPVKSKLSIPIKFQVKNYQEDGTRR